MPPAISMLEARVVNLEKPFALVSLGRDYCFTCGLERCRGLAFGLGVWP